MGRCLRVDLGLTWLLVLTPACFSEPGSGTGTADAEADGSTAAMTTSQESTSTGSGASDSSSSGDLWNTTSTTGGSSSSFGSSSSSGFDDVTSTTDGPPPEFFDDFDRGTTDTIGNGWMEKLPAAWRILNDSVASQSTPSGNSYYDFLVYRFESVRDLTIQIEFSISVESDSNEPHLVLRAQQESLEAGNPFHGYILVPRPSFGDLCIMRFRDSPGWTGLSCDTLPTGGLSAGAPYRLTFTAAGDQPVQLDGTLEAFNGGAWVEVADVSWTDSEAAALISEPGAYGFSGGTGPNQLGNYRLDNFSATFGPM